MKLRLENVSMITEATVEVVGVTVITGDNDTGKSTVGKALFSLFNSFFDTKRQHCLEILDAVINVIPHPDFDPLAQRENYIEFADVLHYAQSMHVEISKQIVRDFELTEILNQIKSQIHHLPIEESVKEKVISDIDNKASLSPSTYNNLRLHRFLNGNFTNHVTTLGKPENTKSLIGLSMKQDTIQLQASIVNSTLELYGSESLYTQAIFIDSPRILDAHLWLPASTRFSTEAYLRKLLEKPTADNLSDQADFSNKFQDIVACFNKINIGSLNKEKNRYFYTSPNGQTLPIRNISTGIKVFAIIRHLFFNQSLEANGTLILDEPEIHLHPDWQLTLAELIVLLQRDLGMHILLTTHSPYFLEAIEVYSEKYGIQDKCRYYMSRKEEGGVVFDDYTGRTVPDMYDHFAKAYQTLERETYAPR